MFWLLRRSGFVRSLPSRGAWIEIQLILTVYFSAWVAPLAGSVDRNTKAWYNTTKATVAPLAGSVDRNQKKLLVVFQRRMSLPSRGAWIEIGRQEVK